MPKTKINKCPKSDCQSLDVWKFGFTITKNGKRQRFQCKKCGHIWREE